MNGNDLMALRICAGYSRENLADKLDVCINSIRDWEVGIYRIRAINRFALLYVFEQKAQAFYTLGKEYRESYYALNLLLRYVKRLDLNPSRTVIDEMDKIVIDASKGYPHKFSPDRIGKDCSHELVRIMGK